MDITIIKKSMCLGVEVGGASVIRLAIHVVCQVHALGGRLAWLPSCSKTSIERN